MLLFRSCVSSPRPTIIIIMEICQYSNNGSDYCPWECNFNIKVRNITTPDERVDYVCNIMYGRSSQVRVTDSPCVTNRALAYVDFQIEQLKRHIFLLRFPNSNTQYQCRKTMLITITWLICHMILFSVCEVPCMVLKLDHDGSWASASPKRNPAQQRPARARSPRSWLYGIHNLKGLVTFSA